MEKTTFAEALAAQPDNLEVSVREVGAALAAQDLPPWQRTDTVSVVAMGASTHSGEALVAALRRAGRFGVNLNAADIAHAPVDLVPGDHFLLVSESGRSPEPVDAAAHLTAGRRIAVTNDPGAPLAALADHVLPLGGWDDSRVYTSGFTATLLAYAALLRHQLGAGAAGDPRLVPDLLRRAADAWSSQVSAAATLLRDARAVDVVAQGISLAAAGEGALMLREGARLHATAFDTYQYIHGPMESLGEGSALVVLGDARELPVVDLAVARGIPTVLVTAAPAGLTVPASDRLVVWEPPAGATDVSRAVLETAFLQHLTLELTHRLGLDIDEFLFDQPDTKLASTQAD